MFNVNIYGSDSVFENPKGRSEVIPNQAMSIREIVARSSRGQVLSEVQGNELQYGEDEDEDGNDIVEYDDDKFEVRDKLSYLEERINSAKAAQEALKKQKEAEEEANASKAPEEAPNAS